MVHGGYGGEESGGGGGDGSGAVMNFRASLINQLDIHT